MRESIALRWSRWSERSVISRIFAAALTVGTLTLVAKLALVAKDVLVARRFGTGADLDAYLVTALVPLLAATVIGGTFQVAFVPTYIRVRENEGREQAQALLSEALACILMLLAAVALLVGLGSPWLLGWLGRSFTPEQLVLSKRLLWLLLPLVVLAGLSAAWSSVLTAAESFALPALVQVITPVMMAVGILAFGRRLGVYALGFGVLAGTAMELAVIGRALARRGISVMPRWRGLSAPLRVVLAQYGPMAAAGFISSGNGFVDQAIAARLGEGNVSTLSYAGKLVSFVLALGGTAIGTAVFPHFSRMLATDDIAGVRHTLKTYLPLILIATIPVTGVLMALSEPIVAIAFQRGAFTAADAHRVAGVQMLYLIQVPFAIAVQMGVRLMAAGLMTAQLGWLAVGLFALNAVLDVILAPRLGAAGIALSTALVAVGCFGWVYTVLWRRYRGAGHG
jgi:putative peptidoglycan lipid II flippase